MQPTKPSVVIACGGTGGHVFPGIAVMHALMERGVEVTLVVSEKRVDREAVADLESAKVETIPSVAFGLRSLPSFIKTLVGSTFRLLRQFRSQRPAAVLSMGGFTSAAPILAAWFLRIPVLIHEANSMPGRANRLFARIARTVLLHFDESREHIRHRDVRVVGMPVRSEFQPRSSEMARVAAKALGFDPDRPLLAVIGGSQGARPINDLVIDSLELLSREIPAIQVLHVAGTRDLEQVRKRYWISQMDGRVEGFFTDMPNLLAAASVVISRAGASSLAEISRVGVPSVLIPFPQAADDHQSRNAEAFVPYHRAALLKQSEATPERLVDHVRSFVNGGSMTQSAGGSGGADPAVTVVEAILALPGFPPAGVAETPSSPLGACARKLAV